MRDRHKHLPITFRPSPDNRAWLERHAAITGRPTRKILAEALTLYRELHAGKAQGSARRIIEMLNTGQHPEDLSYDEKWAAARDATQLLLKDAFVVAGQQRTTISGQQSAAVGGQVVGSIDDLLGAPATNLLDARREDVRSSVWDQADSNLRDAAREHIETEAYSAPYDHVEDDNRKEDKE